MTKKKIIVTGALGHIGSAFIRSFVPEQVDSIIMIDNLESQRYASLFNLPSGIQYRFIQADIRTVDYETILPGCDLVIHLAALTNAAGSLDKAAEVESVNFGGTQRLADACLRHGVKLLFPSTTSIYGSQEAVVDETCTQLLPQSPYAESKLKAESYLRQLGQRGLTFVICRFGTIFGWSVGMRWHTAVNKFIWQAVTGQPLTVWKTAWGQRRPYLALDDCLRAMQFIIEQDLFDGQIYNVLTDNFSMRQVVAAIQERIPDIAVNYVDSPIMNQLSYDVSAKKFSDQGFAAAGQLARGISDTIQRLNGLTVSVSQGGVSASDKV